MKKAELTTIGSTVYVDIKGEALRVPAKVDTGADASSIWASNVFIDEAHKLHFTLFDKASPFYTGKDLVDANFRVAMVKTSTGHKDLRYAVHLSVTMHGRTVRTTFNLSNRSRNRFPILIGRRTIKRKFLVDVAKGDIKTPEASTFELNQELKKDPHSFFKKYHIGDSAIGEES